MEAVIFLLVFGLVGIAFIASMDDMFKDRPE
jgi:hypothetical protein